MNKKQIQAFCAVLAVLPSTALIAVCQPKTTTGENAANLPKVFNFSAPQKHEIEPQSL